MRTRAQVPRGAADTLAGCAGRGTDSTAGSAPNVPSKIVDVGVAVNLLQAAKGRLQSFANLQLLGVLRPLGVFQKLFQVRDVPLPQARDPLPAGLSSRSRYQSLASSDSRVNIWRMVGDSTVCPSNSPSAMMCSRARSGRTGQFDRAVVQVRLGDALLRGDDVLDAVDVIVQALQLGPEHLVAKHRRRIAENAAEERVHETLA